MKYVEIIDSMKAIAVRSDQLQKDYRGSDLPPKEIYKLLKADQKRPFEERLNLYACERAKKEFEEARTKYPDYTFTEYCNAF